MADDRKDPVPFEKPHAKAGRDQQKGAQQHAQGMHGPKSRAHLIDQLQSGSGGGNDDTRSARDPNSHDEPGKHRLFEQREQHDEADKNSDKNRLEKDIQDHDHNRENFQVRGGAASSRAERPNHINPSEPDAPTPGLKMPPPPDRVP